MDIITTILITANTSLLVIIWLYGIKTIYEIILRKRKQQNKTGEIKK